MGIRKKRGRFWKAMAARALVTALQDTPWKTRKDLRRLRDLIGRQGVVEGVGEQVPQKVNSVSVSSRDGRHGLRRDGGYGWPRLG